MGKLSFKRASSKLAKHAINSAGQIAKTSVKHAVSLGKKVATIEIPSSLNWIFGFGFKVGCFLLLKSFLILRYQIFNLRMSGFIMIITQFVQALFLISCGLLMQNRRLYDDPIKLRKIAGRYGYGLFIGMVVFVLREFFDWSFFKEPKAVNWFVDIFTGISKEASEIGLGLLFWDCDLWGAFSGLLYFITVSYLHVSFEYKSGLWAAVFRNVHFLRSSTNHSELVARTEPEIDDISQINSNTHQP